MKMFWKKIRNPVRVYIEDRERTIKEEQMRERQLMLQHAMGFDPSDPAQCWMRLHEILMDHENRISKLEGF
jgi:hypothetical protein